MRRTKNGKAAFLSEVSVLPAGGWSCQSHEFQSRPAETVWKFPLGFALRQFRGEWPEGQKIKRGAKVREFTDERKIMGDS